MTDVNLTIARVVQTCRAMPSQWDAWNEDGQYLYLRFRHSVGTVEPYDSPDWNTWEDDVQPVAEFVVDEYRSEITLEEFAERAGLTLAIQEAPENDPPASP